MLQPRILVVEDNPVDVEMIKRALKRGGLEVEPDVVDDGAPAIALLAREEGYRDIPLPDLVLLDLKLRTVSGPQVLQYIRESPALNHVSVAILSCTSTDISSARHMAADCFFMKPSDLDAFEKLGSEILDCFQHSKHRAGSFPRANAAVTGPS